MNIIIYNNKGEEVFNITSEEFQSGTEDISGRFKQFMKMEVTSIEMILEDKMTLDNFNYAISDGNGIGIVKTQIINLK